MTFTPAGTGGGPTFRYSLICAVLSLLCINCSIAGDGATTSTANHARVGGPTRALGFYKPGVPISLEEGFRDPPAISRVQCWWQPPGSPFTKEEITRELEQFKAQGMGGVTIKDTTEMPRDEHTAHIKDIPYMNEQWLDMYAHIVSECGRLGLICRSRSGSGWNEGGPWIPPELSVKALFFVKSQPLQGPTTYSGPIPRETQADLKPVARGQEQPQARPTTEQLKAEEAFVLAVCEDNQRVIDLTGQVSETGTLTWDVPEGRWTLLSCYGKPTGKKLMSASATGGGLHADNLSAVAADLHIQEFMERMRTRVGGFENTAFDGYNSDGFELGLPTWTPGLRHLFLQRCGYDPVLFFPLLAGYDLGEAGQRFLYDLRTTVADLIVANHYSRYAAWCREHGVAFEAQCVGGPSHRHTHDFITASGAVDIPMGETWIHGRAYVKMASSAAHAYGKPLIGLEYGTQKTWFYAPTPMLLRMRADESFLLGANYLCLPCVDYTPPEAGYPGWVHSQPGRLGLGQTWWSLSRPLFDYLARCCFLLQSGEPVASVAVYNSFHSQERMLWLSPEDDRLSGFPKQYDFDYISDDLLVNHMGVENGRIVLPSGARYEILYISPPVLHSGGMGPQPTTFTRPRVNMPLESLLKVRDMVRQGATVVWAGEMPKRSPSLKGQPDADVLYESVVKELQADRRLTRLPEHNWNVLDLMLAKSAQPPAWRLSEDVPLRFVHRRLPKADIFFITHRGVQDNYKDMTDLLWTRKADSGAIVHELFAETDPVRTPVTFRIKGRRPEFWWAESGRIEPAPFQETSDGVLVTVKLDPYASVFVIFRDEPSGDRQATGDERRTPGGEQPIEGPWELSFPAGWRTPEKITLTSLKSWTDMEDIEVRHFNGIATYRTTFTVAPEAHNGKTAELDLGRVADICEVWLSGQRVGIAWRAPYRLDITGALLSGENRLEVRVTASWHNRLVRDAALPKDERVSRMYPESRYPRFKGRALIESGLLGPVRIRWSQEQALVPEERATMKRKAYRMRLKPGCEAEYKRRHDEMWPEMREQIVAKGVSDYSIFLDRETGMLFAVQKLSDDSAVGKLPPSPLVRKWWAYMADIMEYNPDGTPVQVPLEEVFRMD